MLDIFNKNKLEKKRIHISPEFPKDIVVKVFKPYLLLFTNSKHLLIPILKRKSAFKLHNKLLNFQKFNPLFGRLKIKYIKKIINNEVKIVKIKEYNDNYILFENNNNSKFLCDHLSYTHKHYIITVNSYYEDSTEEEDEQEEEDDHTQDDDDQTQDDDDQTQHDDVSSEGFDIDNEIIYVEEG
jgi:hypothetical protein